MLDSPSTASDKRRLRTRAKGLRAALGLGHRAASAVAGHGLGFLDSAPGVVVGGYYAVREEFDVLPLLERLEGENYRLALPLIVSAGAPLLYRHWRPGDELVDGAFGIPAPRESAQEVRPDVILTPLLAFDPQGYRLGYGGGFYDRTLAAYRRAGPVVAVGVAFDEQEVPHVPHGPGDIRIDWVLTPSGPRRLSP